MTVPNNNRLLSQDDEDTLSICDTVALMKSVSRAKPPLLVTDSLATLEACAKELRTAAAAAHGSDVASDIHVRVTPRQGQPDHVCLGPLDVLVDPRASTGQVFWLQIPVERRPFFSLDAFHSLTPELS